MTRERGMSVTTQLAGDEAARRRRLCSGGAARDWRNGWVGEGWGDEGEKRTNGRGVMREWGNGGFLAAFFRYDAGKSLLARPRVGNFILVFPTFLCLLLFYFSMYILLLEFQLLYYCLMIMT